MTLTLQSTYPIFISSRHQCLTIYVRILVTALSPASTLPRTRQQGQIVGDYVCVPPYVCHGAPSVLGCLHLTRSALIALPSFCHFFFNSSTRRNVVETALTSVAKASHPFLTMSISIGLRDLTRFNKIAT